jgi:hypothetical protein
MSAVSYSADSAVICCISLLSIFADDTTLLNVKEDNIELKHMVASSLADIDLDKYSTVNLLGINIDSRLS